MRKPHNLIDWFIGCSSVIGYIIYVVYIIRQPDQAGHDSKGLYHSLWLNRDDGGSPFHMFVDALELAMLGSLFWGVLGSTAYRKTFSVQWVPTISTVEWTRSKHLNRSVRGCLKSNPSPFSKVSASVHFDKSCFRGANTYNLGIAATILTPKLCRYTAVVKTPQ